MRDEAARALIVAELCACGSSNSEPEAVATGWRCPNSTVSGAHNQFGSLKRGPTRVTRSLQLPVLTLCFVVNCRRVGRVIQNRER